MYAKARHPERVFCAKALQALAEFLVVPNSGDPLRRKMAGFDL
jgi:hypothetical protein